MNSSPNARQFAQTVDSDPAETKDWLLSLKSVTKGEPRARFLLDALDRRAKEIGIVEESHPYSPYRNTIELEKQPPLPGDLAMEERIT